MTEETKICSNFNGFARYKCNRIYRKQESKTSFNGKYKISFCILYVIKLTNKLKFLINIIDWFFFFITNKIMLCYLTHSLLNVLFFHQTEIIRFNLMSNYIFYVYLNTPK